MTYPTTRLDDDVHQRVRLGILALLSGVDRADFNQLKKALDTTDGNLGRHLQVLERSRLIVLRKDTSQPRTRTWASITRAGRRALSNELDALKQLVALVETPTTKPELLRTAPLPTLKPT
jgi:DNA-binding MarR family transcriptional regulator